jgi:hypothetical protein
MIGAESQGFAADVQHLTDTLELLGLVAPKELISELSFHLETKAFPAFVDGSGHFWCRQGTVL